MPEAGYYHRRSDRRCFAECRKLEPLAGRKQRRNVNGHSTIDMVLPKENINWVAEIPGRGHSTPIVWGDRVFITTAVPTGTATEITSQSATGPSPRATQQSAQRSGGNAMTPAMRERLLEITGGKELSELSRAQRRQATQQLRRESSNATRRSVAGGQPWRAREQAVRYGCRCQAQNSLVLSSGPENGEPDLGA